MKLRIAKKIGKAAGEGRHKPHQVAKAKTVLRKRGLPQT